MQRAAQRVFTISNHLVGGEESCVNNTAATKSAGSKPKIDIEAMLTENRKDYDKIIESWLPRTFNAENMQKICGKARYQHDIEGATVAVAKPIWDILDRGGKRWRPLLLMLVAEALRGDLDLIKPLLVLCEVVHNGTLVVDDIEDSSLLRRGKPCLHITYGVDVAINAGNAMYFLPTVILHQLRNTLPPQLLLSAYELYTQELINLHFGQGSDIAWHNSLCAFPNSQQYLQMCAYKTGTLARLSAKLSALFSGASNEQIEAIGKFAESIGVAFQIQDDLLNLRGGSVAVGKGGVGEDITEGKKTLMVIHRVEQGGEGAKRLREIIDKKTSDPALIGEAIDLMEKGGSMEWAEKEGKRIVEEAWAGVERVLEESEGKRKLEAFARFLVERKI
eukprot:TRINITY_DN8138_c0_g1_i1.p1 TRINITY_DN8138_c0_g1~~TRINITY_DN8138_c0_g1_i1.p1  ORF type:complete len:391 (-),score=122.02 TRINITY_DN8138_c0_g1_i1:47-1219(-)